MPDETSHDLQNTFLCKTCEHGLSQRYCCKNAAGDKGFALLIPFPEIPAGQCNI